MKNTNVTYQQNNEYGSELTYEIRFGFYKSGHPKIGLYCRDKKLSEMTADYRGDMPDDHVAIALDNEGHIGRLYREGLIATSEPVETIPWGDMRRLGFFPLTFAGIGELGVAALDENIGFNFTGVDLCFLGDGHIDGPGGFKYASGSGGSLYTHKFHATTPHRRDLGFLDYAVEKMEGRWGKGRGVGIVIESCKSRYAPKWKTHKKVRDIILEEMVKRHGINIPEGDNPMDRWDDFKTMLKRNEVPPIHLNSGIWKLDYHYSIGYHFENYNDSYGGIDRYYECLLLHRVKEEDLQDSSVPVHGATDTIRAGQETEPVRELILKDREWKGETINLNIEAIHHKSRNNVWYKVTGEYASGEMVYFTPFDWNVYRFPNSVGIWERENHEKIVQLLYSAGIITDEKTGSYTCNGIDIWDETYICYRLTDQAIEYANLGQKTTLSRSEDVNTSNMNGEETEALQESSNPIKGTVDNAQSEQEEEYPGLRLKNHEWRGREINLYIEAKQPYPNYNPWYDITGYYTCGGEEIQFSQYTFDFFRYRDSAAIDMWEDHDKIVRLLYNAGVITKEKTYTSIGLEKKCICYRLTDQALAYAHREQ